LEPASNNRRDLSPRGLKKLDIELTDESGLVPHSAKWRAYRTDWLQKLVDGEARVDSVLVAGFESGALDNLDLRAGGSGHVGEIDRGAVRQRQRARFG
jgi:hypothetical protein